MSTAYLAANPRSKGRLWPALVIGVLAVHSIGMIFAVLIAVRLGPPEVEPRFYEKALAWDATSAQRDASRALGWHVQWDAQVGPADSSSVRITDAAGVPVEGASCEVEFFHRAHSRDRAFATLTPVSDGRYLLPLSLKRAGEHEFRIVVRRGTDTFTGVDLSFVRPRAPSGASTP